jgi:hypothetical protein
MAEDVIGSGQTVSESKGEEGYEEKENISPERKALVEKWQAKLKKAIKRWENDFKQMKICMKLATVGAQEKEWVEAKKVVVPILARHINQEVSHLYAKHPTTIAKRKKRMLFKIWDGKPDTAQAAIEALGVGDMSQMALVQDIAEGQQYMMLVDKIAKTLEILWSYYLSEQEYDYKSQLKALVRRTKTNGAGYIKLGFQRIMQPNPEIESKIADETSKILSTQRMLDDAANGVGEIDPEAPDIEQLRLNKQDLENQLMMVVREGPVLSFPRSTAIVPDPQCKHLKSFAGARYLFEHIGDFTCDEIKELYGKNIKKSGYTAYKDKASDGSKNEIDEDNCRVWQGWDKVNRQCFTICEGYCDFLKEPATPDVPLERFYPYFPLVFNEVESEDTIFPPSDVWNARFIQDDYNAKRQGVREHRRANRPWYAVRKGGISEADKNKLADHAAHEIVEFDHMGPNDDIQKIVQRGPAIAIDPVQYDVEETFMDLMRVVGTQQANLGPTTGDTATETSIAENSRQSSQSSNTDDLDDLLTSLGRSAMQLMLAELELDTVIDIAGPGAAWPEHEMTREEIAKDLQFDIEAGSSGRPNKAAELANIERAAPTLMQIPGMNPAPMAKKYLNLLDMDVEEGYVEGLPSIIAVNAMANAKQAVPAAKPGDPNAPAAQGPAGAQNTQKPAQSAPQSQPAFPPPGGGAQPMSGATSSS